MNVKQLTSFIVFVIILFSSCDEGNYVYYIVENQSNDNVKIDYSYFTYYSNEESESNSLIINSNEEDTLFIFELISPSVYNKDDGDVLEYLFNVDVNRIVDTVRMTKDILRGENWEFDKVKDNFANFKFIVEEKDF